MTVKEKVFTVNLYTGSEWYTGEFTETKLPDPSGFVWAIIETVNGSGERVRSHYKVGRDGWEFVHEVTGGK